MRSSSLPYELQESLLPCHFKLSFPSFCVFFHLCLIPLFIVLFLLSHTTSCGCQPALRKPPRYTLGSFVWVRIVSAVDRLISPVSVQMPSVYVTMRIKLKNLNLIKKPTAIYHGDLQVETVVKIQFLSEVLSKLLLDEVLVVI